MLHLGLLPTIARSSCCLSLWVGSGDASADVATDGWDASESACVAACCGWAVSEWAGVTGCVLECCGDDGGLVVLERCALGVGVHPRPTHATCLSVVVARHAATLRPLGG